MGTPQQKIEGIVMDTGSFLPWVKVKGDDFCSSPDVCPGIEPTYEGSKSSTFSFNNNETCSLSFGSGSF